jgi:hypothetical protein
MSVYAGNEGSKSSRRYRKMSTMRYYLHRRDFFTESDKRRCTYYPKPESL